MLSAELSSCPKRSFLSVTRWGRGAPSVLALARPPSSVTLHFLFSGWGEGPGRCNCGGFAQRGLFSVTGLCSQSTASPNYGRSRRSGALVGGGRANAKCLSPLIATCPFASPSLSERRWGFVLS